MLLVYLYFNDNVYLHVIHELRPNQSLPINLYFVDNEYLELRMKCNQLRITDAFIFMDDEYL